MKKPKFNDPKKFWVTYVPEQGQFIVEMTLEDGSESLIVLNQALLEHVKKEALLKFAKALLSEMESKAKSA